MSAVFRSAKLTDRRASAAPIADDASLGARSLKGDFGIRVPPTGSPFRRSA